MTDDDKAEQPTYFNPGIAFRFPLALISGNRSSLEAALRCSPELARLFRPADLPPGALRTAAKSEATRLLPIASKSAVVERSRYAP